MIVVVAYQSVSQRLLKWFKWW